LAPVAGCEKDLGFRGIVPQNNSSTVTTAATGRRACPSRQRRVAVGQEALGGAQSERGTRTEIKLESGSSLRRKTPCSLSAEANDCGDWMRVRPEFGPGEGRVGQS
jgi:hypothetical protein